MHQSFVRCSFTVVIGCGGSLAIGQITPTDLSGLSLGAKIVGPVGPEVETTIAFDDGGTITGIADLASSVSCDDRFAADCSAAAVAGTDDVVYTYVHTVVPGVDFPNDPPFPAPDVVVPLDDATEFRLSFPAHGFNGVAGYDFAEATAAVGATPFTILQLTDDALVWSVPDGSGWDTGEPITFFWQTSQRPVGPGGIYAATNGTLAGTGNGPLPAPVIPEPATVVLVVIGLLLTKHRRAA